ncbi:unnamed protein product [Gadus morhua 'NCC']
MEHRRPSSPLSMLSLLSLAKQEGSAGARGHQTRRRHKGVVDYIKWRVRVWMKYPFSVMRLKPSLLSDAQLGAGPHQDPSWATVTNRFGLYQCQQFLHVPKPSITPNQDTVA